MRAYCLPMLLRSKGAALTIIARRVVDRTRSEMQLDARVLRSPRRFSTGYSQKSAKDMMELVFFERNGEDFSRLLLAGDDADLAPF